MFLVPEETSLVIAGAWNPAILTPDWVLKFGLQKFEGARAQAFFPAGISGVFEFPRFQLENDFSYMVRPDALVVTPSEPTDAKLGLAEDVVARMVSVLKYTPVNGVGHNFEFRDTTPEIPYLDAFTLARQDIVGAIGEEWRPAATSLKTSFSKDGGKVIVNIQRDLDAGILSVKFNFHHSVSSVDDVLGILNGKNGFARMADNLSFAREIINKVYGECA